MGVFMAMDLVDDKMIPIFVLPRGQSCAPRGGRARNLYSPTPAHWPQWCQAGSPPFPEENCSQPPSPSKWVSSL